MGSGGTLGGLGPVREVHLLRGPILSLRPAYSAETPLQRVGTRLGGFGLRLPASLRSRPARYEAFSNGTWLPLLPSTRIPPYRGRSRPGDRGGGGAGAADALDHGRRRPARGGRPLSLRVVGPRRPRRPGAARTLPGRRGRGPAPRGRPERRDAVRDRRPRARVGRPASGRPRPRRAAVLRGRPGRGRRREGRARRGRGRRRPDATRRALRRVLRGGRRAPRGRGP